MPNKVLWDLGVSIKSNNKIIKPLISNTQIIPEYNKNTDMHNLDIMKNQLSHDHIIKILYVSDRYAELVQYFDNQISSEDQLDDKYTIIYSDALYRLGKYNDAINSLNDISPDYPKDEKYFLFALYNKKIGNTEVTKIYLNKLISNYPNSEYYKLAKLQYKTIQ